MLKESETNRTGKQVVLTINLRSVCAQSKNNFLWHWTSGDDFDLQQECFGMTRTTSSSGKIEMFHFKLLQA